jgi:hypothetical protein
MRVGPEMVSSSYGNMETKKSWIFDASSFVATSQAIEKQDRLSMQQRPSWTTDSFGKHLPGSPASQTFFPP